MEGAGTALATDSGIKVIKVYMITIVRRKEKRKRQRLRVEKEEKATLSVY